MNWARTALAALVGGIVMWLVSFLLHGIAMNSVYMGLPELFVQENGNPFSFLVLEILIAFPAGVIFAKTRGSWGAGIGGGLEYGFWLGLIGSFAQHFNSIIFVGFPYYLGWCWFGINLITTLALGATFGLMMKKA